MTKDEKWDGKSIGAKRVYDTPGPKDGRIFWAEDTSSPKHSCFKLVDRGYSVLNSEVEKICCALKGLKHEEQASIQTSGVRGLMDIIFTLKDDQTLAIRLASDASECTCHPADFLFITENRIEEIRDNKSLA